MVDIYVSKTISLSLPIARVDLILIVAWFLTFLLTSDQYEFLGKYQAFNLKGGYYIECLVSESEW